MKKVVKILLFTIIIVTTNIISVSAAQSNPKKEVIVSEEYANAQKEIGLRYGEREEITVVNTEYKNVVVTPAGQFAGGENFPAGGGLYINADAGGSQSVSVGVSWGIANFSVSIGQASKNSTIGGRFVSFPADNHYYLVKINRTMKIERHKVDVYQYNEYKYTYYATHSKIHDQSYPLVKVK